MTPLLDPRRHAPVQTAAVATLQPAASGNPLSLAGGGRGWTSAGVSVVIRPGATVRELREAARVLEEAADG